MGDDDAPLVRLEEASKIYQMGEVEVTALAEVSLELSAGEFVVLLGPSGSGKTTLLNLVGGLDRPTRGRVVVGGSDLTELDDAALTEHRRRAAGFIFQFLNLIPTLTARENVELAAELVDRLDRVDCALEQVGLADRAEHFPSELSGGEQQRVAIARAMVKEPRLLLADEPTGNLDFETGVRVLRSLYDVSRDQGQLVLLVTHNAVIGQMADRVIHLHSGRVTEVERNDSPAEPESLSW